MKKFFVVFALVISIVAMGSGKAFAQSDMNRTEEKLEIIQNQYEYIANYRSDLWRADCILVNQNITSRGDGGYLWEVTVYNRDLQMFETGYGYIEDLDKAIQVLSEYC